MTSKSPSSPSLLPVFYFHGVTQTPGTGARFAAEMAVEGRLFVPLSFASGPVDSIRSVRDQVPLAIAQIRERVESDPVAFADGYAFIGYSQGGFLARAVVQEMDDHNVRTLVCLAGITNGMFFGPQPQDTDGLHYFLRQPGPELFPPSVFDLTKYSSTSTQSSGERGEQSLMQRFQADFDAVAVAHPELQQQFSFFNIARSPVAHAWKKANAFLAELNNVSECATPEDEKNRVRRRDNFLKLGAAHFFASPDDGLLAPWQTSILGQYDEVASAQALENEFDALRVLSAKETPEYLGDTYGLRTLDERGGLHLHTIPGVPHRNWITDDITSGSLRFSEIYPAYIHPLL